VLKRGIARAVTLFASLFIFASSLWVASPAKAATYDGVSGTIDCSISGTVTIANNVVTTHSNCSGSVEIPAGVTRIEDSAFEYAPSLQAVTFQFGSQLTSIGYYSFSFAESLTSIRIPASVTSIDEYAFDNATSLISVYFLGNAPSVGSDAFSFVANGAKAVIKSGATGFGNEGQIWNGLMVERERLTVTYNSVGGTSVNSDSFTTGGTIQTAPTSTRAGYTLAGWSTSANGSVIEFPYVPAATSDITLYAIWSANTNAVTYNSAGGTSVNSGSFVTGDSIQTGPTSTRTGYTLTGWSTSEIGSVIEFPYAPTATTDITLYAIWSTNTNAVTYNAGFGSTVSSGSFGTSGTIQTAPTSTRPGYTFLGWSTSENGSVIEFPYSPTATSDITLHAIWSANTNAVTYNSDNGSTVSSGSFTTGGTIQTAPTSTRAGYTFLGWSTSETGSLVEFPYSPRATSDIMLYAIWSANTNAVTYNSDNGSTVSSGSFTTGGTIQTAPTATRPGYTLTGWSMTSENAQDIVTFPYTPTATTDITLYAMWSANTSTVNYNSTGGSTVVPDSFITGGTIQTEPNSTRNGYTLAGWSTSETGSVIEFPYSPTVTSDITLHAIWSINTYNVSFNSQGGSAVANQTLTYGQLLSVAPAPPTLAGFVFAGWSETQGGASITFPYNPSTYSSKTLYAKWIQQANVGAVKPSVTGKVVSTKTGTNKLTVRPGVWTGVPAPTFTYQWYTCTVQIKAAAPTIPKTCTLIKGQTKNLLPVVIAYKGKFLTAAVIGTSAGTPPTTYLTASSAKVT